MEQQWKIILTTLVVFLFLLEQATAQSASEPEFTCRYYGEDYKIGARICLPISGKARLASCGMVLNNSAWAISAKECSPVTEKKARTTSKAQEYIDKYIRDYPSRGKSK
jgi:hypothetical protein